MRLPANFTETIHGLLQEISRREILPRYRGEEAMNTQMKSSPHDPVTDADICAENAIIAAMARILPGAVVVGEESVSKNPDLLSRIGDDGMTVIVDPVDGTLNFSCGIPAFGTMIAVMIGSETVFGAIHEPLTGDTIAAEKGGGAYRITQSGAWIPVAASQDPASPAGTGFINFMAYRKDKRHDIFDRLDGLGHIRSVHCCAVEYRMTITGKAAFNFCHVSTPWDHAPGAFILGEAGGHTSFLDGTPYTPMRRNGQIIAAGSRDVCDMLRDRFSFLDD
jgi:fructose-1,6-bisphosphatase/inositol monophosphatase family enzyme